jgi:hypothetical protein
MTKLELLYAERAKKFDEICALVARELGCGELSTMNGEGRNRVEDEAEQYVEQWEETVKTRGMRPNTPARCNAAGHNPGLAISAAVFLPPCEAP